MAVSNRDDRTFSTPIVLNFFLWFKYTQFPLPERIKEKNRTSTNLNPVFEIKIHKKRTINDSFESWLFPISFLEGEPIWTLFFATETVGEMVRGKKKKKIGPPFGGTASSHTKVKNGWTQRLGRLRLGLAGHHLELLAQQVGRLDGIAAVGVQVHRALGDRVVEQQDDGDDVIFGRQTLADVGDGVAGHHVPQRVGHQFDAFRPDLQRDFRRLAFFLFLFQVPGSIRKTIPHVQFRSHTQNKSNCKISSHEESILYFNGS